MRRLSWLLVILSALTFMAPALAAAADEAEKPARSVVVAMLYPGVTIGAEENIRVDLIVKNVGRSFETMMFQVVEQPKGWRCQIKGYGKPITGIFIASGDERTLTFTADPEGEGKKPAPGEYKFKVKASSLDGALTSETGLAVTVASKAQVGEEIELTTSYPMLSGPTDSKFEFSLDVNNKTDEDKLFNLSAKVPEDWEVSFKPAYEQKQISSIQIKGSQSKSVNLELTPSRKAEAGEYPIRVTVKTNTSQAQVDLVVKLTGTYEIKTGTPTGLLSLTTQTGKPANMSIYVRNEGSAIQREIGFMSFKPESWKVEFKPEKVLELKPGELKQIEVIITPAEQALVGDYSVAVNAQGEKANSNVEFRVTVKASATWGWIGIAIIILVIAGLGVTFRRLGRR